MRQVRIRLQEKIELEHEEVSDELAWVAEDVAKQIREDKLNLTELNPIFRELLQVQSGKPKGNKYHPM
jgi:hypothetical protein